MMTSKSRPDDLPLTEEQLLQMSEEEYMNPAQLEFFRRRLIDLSRELMEHSSETRAHLRDNVVSADPNDRATQEEEHAIELRTRDRERKLLVKIQQALARIDDGSYGYCEETGEPIGLQRLLIRPTATRTLEAQERFERLERIYRQ